jgi:hypothetical protein
VNDHALLAALVIVVLDGFDDGLLHAQQGTP